MKSRSGRVAESVTDGLPLGEAVTPLANLIRSGLTYEQVRAHFAGHRWQRYGRAVVLHNGPLHPDERAAVALVNCGPRVALTAFTLAEHRGLRNWHRDELHLLVPGGARIVRPPGLPMRIHWSSDWPNEDVHGGRHALAPALVLGASTFGEPRPAVGLLAAGVQQRLVTADALRRALDKALRTRHRHALISAVDDIEQGAQALSEIDFARLCRRHGLPEPSRQAVRVERSGRRRYLDAEWRTRTGRRLVAEVDGALHLAPRRWWDDQLRQNEIVLADRIVLRFPSVVVRFEQATVIDQLGRGLAM